MWWQSGIIRPYDEVSCNRLCVGLTTIGEFWKFISKNLIRLCARKITNAIALESFELPSLPDSGDLSRSNTYTFLSEHIILHHEFAS